MPGTVETTNPPPSRTRRPANAKTLPRDLQLIRNLVETARTLYLDSKLFLNSVQVLRTALKGSSLQPTKLVSLGLGSLGTAKGQNRRVKQLAVFLAIGDVIETITGAPLDIYAQDPAFTRNDETLLSSYGILITRTPTGSQLGGAAAVIDSTTIVYSPFLTMEAYEQLLVQSGVAVQFLIGDDFNALLKKWPKHSAEYAQVEGLCRSSINKYRRRGISGEGFWTSEDQSFAMAVYSIEAKGKKLGVQNQ